MRCLSYSDNLSIGKSYLGYWRVYNNNDFKRVLRIFTVTRYSTKADITVIVYGVIHGSALYSGCSDFNTGYASHWALDESEKRLLLFELTDNEFNNTITLELL